MVDVDYFNENSYYKIISINKFECFNDDVAKYWSNIYILTDEHGKKYWSTKLIYNYIQAYGLNKIKTLSIRTLNFVNGYLDMELSSF